MKPKRVFKYGFVLLSLLALLFTVCVIAPQAVPISQAGNLPSTTESGNVAIQNAAGTGNTLNFRGKVVGDYRINGNTALCSFSAGDGVSGYSAKTTKYILGNNTMRAKVMYYLTPQRGSKDTPSGFNDDLPGSLKGKTYLWLYQQLSSVTDIKGDKKTYYDWLYNTTEETYFQTSKINTYADVVKAALFYQQGVSGSQAGNSANQYVVIHSLMDYIQHSGFTAPSYYFVAENSAVMLYKFIKKYEGIIPSLPETTRAYIVNPKPNTNAQTLISIEYYRGYFKINKSSSNASVTAGNINYSLDGAEYSWYKTKAAATEAATAVAAGRAVPKGDNYIGYSKLNSSGESTTLIPKSSSSSALYDLGTYYLVETKAPLGYALSAEVKTLKITSSNRTIAARATVSFTDQPLYGSLTLSKTSSNSSLTKNNSLYSLDGAEYTVYKDSALEKPYKVITTTDGKASLNNIPFGTYYVKETKASKGHTLDTTVYSVEINNAHKSVTVTSVEPVIYVAAPTLIKKQDSETSDPLAGAKFLVEYYDKEIDSQSYSFEYIPIKRWLFETDSDGYIVLDSEHLATEYTNSNGITIPFANDSFYLSENDDSIAVLPHGTIRITEVEAPVVYESDGNRYQYKLDSTPTYRQVVVNNDATAIEYKTVVLNNELEGALSKTIQGEKTWVDQLDEGHVSGNRPKRITVRLIKNVNGVESVAATTTTNAAKQWIYKFTDQPIYETVNGIAYEIQYRVEEDPVPCYWTRYDGLNIVNTEYYTSVKVNKVWDDYNNQDGVRPDTIKVNLYQNGTKTDQSAILSEDNNWSYTFANLPAYRNRQTASYTVVEESEAISEGIYTSTVSPVSGDTETGYAYTITNKHDPEKTSVAVLKKWSDTDDLDSLRPTNIQIKLNGYVNDKEVYSTTVVTMTAYGNATEDNNVWSYTFNDLDKYSDGRLIDYVATELTLVREYNLDENGNPQTITAPLTVQEDGSYACVLENTHVLKKINIDVVKVWDDDDNRDGKRPGSITVYLATVDENGNKTPYVDSNGNNVIGVLQDSTGWTYQFTGLPIYDNNRQVVEYSVEEIVPSGYTVTYSGDAGNGITITNAHHELTSVTVNKAWEDNDDQDGIRPDSVKVNLLADGEKIDDVVLSDNNNWTYTFEELPVNQNGDAIKYTVTEDEIPVPDGFDGSGYTTRYSNLRGSAQMGYSVTVTNFHEPEIRSIDVSKIWNDDNNHDGIRPKQVQVELTVTSPAHTGFAKRSGYMSEDNNWHYTFENLPKYFNGELIRYSVDETDDETDIVIEQSANGYYKEISGNMNDGFIITNTHRNEKIQLIIRKAWDDNNNSERMRPESAEFQIDIGRSIHGRITLNAANGWLFQSDLVDRYYNKNEISPYVEEIGLAEGYVAHSSLKVAHHAYITVYEYTYTNSFEPDPTMIPVTKIWKDFNNMDRTRPRSITVNLYRKPADDTGYGILVGGTTLDEASDWQGHIYGFFPRYINGVEYKYFVQESFSSSLYTTTIEGNYVDGFTIKNTYEKPYTTDVPFKKIWEDDDDRDGLRPDSINIVLIGHNDDWEVVSKRYATVTAADDWVYTFTDLPTYEENGEYSIHYEVEELDTAKGYTLRDIEIEWDGYDYEDKWLTPYMDAIQHVEDNDIWFGLVNEHIPDKTAVTVNKVWDDDSDRDKVRPTALTVNLLANGTKVKEAVLNERNGWSYTFTNLNVNENGTPISYTVTESTFDTPDGYDNYVLTETDSSGNATDGWVYSLTNHYDSMLTRVTVVKQWQDSKNAFSLRPGNLLLILKADGIPVQTYSMTEADADAGSSTSSIDAWKHTFENLPKYNNGVEIQYTVEELLSGTDAFFYRLNRTRTSTDSEGYKTITLNNRNKTASIVLQKKNESGELILGSEFELFLIDGTPLNLQPTTPGSYRYVSGTNTVYGSKVQGRIVNISNLPPNAVIIVREVAAPDGYMPYPEDTLIDIQQIIKENDLESSSSGVYTLPAVTVNNYKVVMPATGGVGDNAFYLMAGMSLIGSILFIIKKRKDVKQ